MPTKIILFLLLLIHIATGIHTIIKNSQTYDEAVHLAAGYSYLKTGKLDMNIYDHPPIAKIIAALPLMFLKLEFIPKSHPWYPNMHANQYRLGDYFIHHNRMDAEKILFAGRLMMLLLSAAFCVWIFLITKKLSDEVSAVISVFIYVFYSSIIANSTLVTTDVPLAFFFFVSFYYFWNLMKDGGIKTAMAAGIFLGLALSSKFSGVMILPLFFILFFYFFFFKKLPGKTAANLTLVSIATSLILWASYLFSSPNMYYEGLTRILKSAAETPRASFLFGKYSVGGWPYYFVATFFLKTPIPLLAVLPFLPFNKKISKNWIFLLLPVVFYLTVSSFSKIQIGHRHIIPVYPFLICSVGILMGDLLRKNIFLKAAVFLSLFWIAYGFVKTHPWHISYFNEIAGGHENGYKFLLDSNIDWGQGLKELSIYLKSENTNHIYFSYFGTGDPHYYGIKYHPLGFVSNLPREGDEIDLTKMPRKFFAVSATNLYANYYEDKEIFSWLRKEEPEEIIAASIFIFDLQKPAVKEGFVDFLKKFGMTPEAEKIRKL